MKLALRRARQAIQQFKDYGYAAAIIFFTTEMNDFIHELQDAEQIEQAGTYYAAYWDTTDEQEQREIANKFFEELPGIISRLEGNEDVK